MSEPLQLIGRIFVSREQLAHFNAHVIDSSQRYGDWGDWLGGKKWYGDSSQEEVVAGADCGKQFEDWFGMFFKEHELWPGAGEFMKIFGVAFNDYDDEAGCWKFMVFEFSENYFDFMSAVNALRQIDSMPGPPIHGQLAIVPYMFGPGFNACEVVVTIADGKSTLSEQVSPEFEAWATHCFETLEFPSD